MKSIKKTISLLLAMIMLFSAAATVFAEIKTYSNGNNVSSSNVFNNGIFSAVSEGTGFFAIALYSEGELKKLNFAQSEDELEEYRVNMVIDDAEKYTMKIFRFDENANPLCINSSLSPLVDNHKIYINESFDNGSNVVEFNSSTMVLSDGRACITYNGSSNGTRFGTFLIPYPDENIIVEADFELPSDGACGYAHLMSVYNGGPKCAVYLHPDGIKQSTSGSSTNEAIVPRSVINADKKFNIAMKINIETRTYDIYYNRQKVTESPRSLSGSISYEGRYDGFSMYIPIVLSEGSIYVDNIKAYSGTEFVDIGNRIPNVNRMDITGSPTWETDIYERPGRYTIAEKVLSTDHPRILLNKEKVEEIKNAKTGRIAKWRDIILPKADSYIDTEPYSYKISSSDSMENIDDAINMFMHLGLAYQLTGDMKYPERAYKELEVIYNVAGNKTTPGGGPDYWNSYSYLCVSELSYAVSICYDWMYDAWTAEQKQAICDNIMERSIKRAYQAIYTELAPTVVGGTSWWKNSNNWNGVCNGTHFLTAIAFMESEPYMCANIAEACYRAFEYMLPRYAPMGAWTEGASYWSYALKYLSVSCAVMDDIFGTDFGIHKTEGLENSMFYALSCEGKTGVMNFGDVGGGHVHAPFLFYWAKKYNNSDIGGAAIYAMNKFGFTPNIYDLLYYDEAYINEDFLQPLSSFYKGTEVVTFASGYDDNDTYLAISGGLGTATSHDHIDSGGIVLEKNGLRVLCDSGAEHYAAASYFSTNRYFYYKARPEGHNIFVINPQNLLDASGKYYHGQAIDALSEITAYDADKQTAAMDLSAAYARDASKAQRTMSMVGDSAVIEDEIELLSDATMPSDGSYIEWYWHFKDTATAVVNNTTKYGVTDYGTAVINEDGKSVTLTFKDYTHDGSKFSYPGTSKSFTLSFESDTDFEIEIRDAVRNPYDAEKIAALQAAGTFSKDYYNSRNTISKVVVKMSGASGNIKLKTTVN